ncbi:16711_t:CDS:2 [Acaulospora morrowiae]|uniref:16711_t:CDS:1 n=1 Tax=Acaulospora morrowiae TaxID=94023 RepID=A0A9N8VPT6_9GLOM|nr:16711_t:CDS:2 [Acaulospora morrowiae]
MAAKQIEKAISHFKELDKEQRKLFLEGLVEECNPQEIYTLQQILQDKCCNRFDIVSALPLELSIKIFKQLDGKDLCNCREVSHRWKNITQDSTIWKTKCLEILMLDQRLEVAKEKESSNEDWEYFYRKLYRKEINWKNGKAQRIKFLKGHKDRVNDAKLKDNTLVTGSADRTVRIWDLETGQCKLTLNGNVFSCVDFLPTEKIVAASTYFRSSFIWNMETGELLNELRGHVSAVRCISLSESFIASCAFDGSVIVWNWKLGEKIVTIPADASLVRIFDTTVLALCGKDIKAFDLLCGDCIFSATFETGLLGWSYIQKYLSTMPSIDELQERILELPNIINRIGHGPISRAHDFDTRRGRLVSADIGAFNLLLFNEETRSTVIEYPCKDLDGHSFHKEKIGTVNIDHYRIIVGYQSGLIAILEFD